MKRDKHLRLTPFAYLPRDPSLRRPTRLFIPPPSLSSSSEAKDLDGGFLNGDNVGRLRSRMTRGGGARRTPTPYAVGTGVPDGPKNKRFSVTKRDAKDILPYGCVYEFSPYRSGYKKGGSKEPPFRFIQILFRNVKLVVYYNVLIHACEDNAVVVSRFCNDCKVILCGKYLSA